MPADDQHPLPLSQDDLVKIAVLVVRHLLTNNNAAQTPAAALVPPALSPATIVVQSSLTTPTSSPAATVFQSSLTTPPIEVGTSTPIMALTRSFEQVGVTEAHQTQVTVSVTSTQATPNEGQPPPDVPCKLLIRGYV